MQITNKDLEILYKLITREQATGYKDTSSQNGFEDFVNNWCDKFSTDDTIKLKSIIDDIRSVANGYGTAKYEVRERKVSEIGRILLSLRDLLTDQNEKYHTLKEIDIHKQKGLEYKQEGNLSSAIMEFEKALDLKHDDSFALLHLSHIYFIQGKLEESRRLIDQVLKSEPLNIYANSIKGEILILEGNFIEASEIFDAIININPNDTYAYSRLGMIYRKLGRIDEALSVLNRGLEIDSNSASLHRALGDVYAALNRDEESMAEYQKALDLDPDDYYAFSGLVSQKTKTRDVSSAISQLQKILKIPSHYQNPHLHALLAKYLKDEGQYESAASELRESIKLKPDSLYFQIQLALCLLKLHKYQKVIDILEPIIKIRTNDVFIIKSLVNAYGNVGRIDDARRLLINALHVYPNDRWLRKALMKLKRKSLTTMETGDGK
ncbi:MAG: tetratricopeptide repeat protein [bacterium]